jgi:hypothetical protein
MSKASSQAVPVMLVYSWTASLLEANTHGSQNSKKMIYSPIGCVHLLSPCSFKFEVTLDVPVPYNHWFELETTLDSPSITLDPLTILHIYADYFDLTTSISLNSSNFSWIDVDLKDSTEENVVLPAMNFSKLFKDSLRIGKGSYSEVFSLSDDYALKKLHSIPRKQVLQEFKVWSRMPRHENVVSCIGRLVLDERDERDGGIGFVMERFDSNLKEYLASKHLPLENLVGILKQVATGMEFLHSNGIVHRDLNSKNILVKKDRVAIGDFGMAISLFADDGEMLGEFEEEEGSGFLWQSCDELIGLGSDVYSFGILMWQVLTFGDLMQDWKLAYTENKSLAEWILFQISMKRAEIPTGLAELIKECLQENPDNRPTAKLITEKLEQHMPAH